MGRFYNLSKEIGDEARDRISREIQELDHVNRVWYSEEPVGLCIFADDDAYTNVMNRTVNICSRDGAGAELSFGGYVQEDGSLVLF